MENKIDISKLLKDCPKGMELDCTTWENVTFEEVRNDTIIIVRNNKQPYVDKVALNKYGRITSYEDEKCRIFPKGKTTWEGFHRPFVDGDILATNDGKFVAIIKKNGGKYYCSCYTNGNYFVTDYSGWFDRFATEEEKQKLFKVIKNHGYRWNPETKTLEELPIFKVGDRIKLKNSKFVYTITDLLKDKYRATTNSRDLYEIEFERQDAYILVPNKFDITTLKPFDKVLVRDYNNECWMTGIYSHQNNNIFIASGHWNQCIPYEGNEHLLGTTNSCDDYFKTWNDE